MPTPHAPADSLERDLLERFTRYIAYDTAADPAATTTPSSPGQMDLARQLGRELDALGLEDVRVDTHAYVTAALPGRNAPHAPVIALLAHLDTATEASGKGVCPQIIYDYDGGDIALNPSMVLSPVQFPALLEERGKTLVVTDGTTLLGADDKSGIAIIMCLLAYLRTHPDTAHPPLRIVFVPDEEIGHGAALLNLEALGADFGYTLDGTGLGFIEYENFNAARAVIDIRGLSIHPGHATGLMVNAVLLAQEVLCALPADETPATTQQREGFFHVTGVHGDVGQARIDLIIRDHDAMRFAQRKQQLCAIIDALNARHPAQEGEAPRLSLAVTDQYRNMREQIEPHRHIVDTALHAMAAMGLTTKERAIRGGTDGAQLSWRGLPCPNLFIGDHNAHGPYEYVAVEDMLASLHTLLHILKIYAAGIPKEGHRPYNSNSRLKVLEFE